MALLARHPGVRLTHGHVVECGFGRPSAAPLGAGVGWPGRAAERGAARHRKPTSRFLPFPSKPPRNWRRRSSRAGVRVIDLSGAFRIRDAAARTRWYPATGTLPERRRVRPDGIFQGRSARRAARGQSGLLSDGGAARRCCRSVARDCSTPSAGVIVDAKSGISGAGRAPSDRTHFSENHGSVSAYGIFEPSARRRDGAGTRRDGDVRAAPGAARSRHSRNDLREDVAPGTTAEQIADAYQRRPIAHEPFVRLTGDALPEIKHVAWTNFCDIGWRFDAAIAPARHRVVPRQSREGRGGPGAAELQRRVRLGRTDGIAVSGPLVLKLGGELLETPADRARIASLAVGDRRRIGRSSSCTAAAARSTPNSIGARITPKKVDGLRITDRATLDVVVSVLAGTSNTELVAALVARGVPAVGLTGVDAGLGRATRTAAHRSTAGAVVDLGFVGDPAEADPSLHRTAAGARLRAGRRESRHQRTPAHAADAVDSERQRRRHGVPHCRRAGRRDLVIAGGTAGVLDAQGESIAHARRGRHRCGHRERHGDGRHGGQARRRAARRCSKASAACASSTAAASTRSTASTRRRARRWCCDAASGTTATSGLQSAARGGQE